MDSVPDIALDADQETRYRGAVFDLSWFTVDISPGFDQMNTGDICRIL